MGLDAFHFADFLHTAGQRLWQILPLNPTQVGSGNSPYHSQSVFAGNSLFISPDFLVRDGFLRREDIPPLPETGRERVDFHLVTAHREELLAKTFAVSGGHPREGYDDFCRRHSGWLGDYALFSAAKRKYAGRQWREWPDDIRRRDPSALERLAAEMAWEVEKEKFIQYLFFRQWKELREHCAGKGIRILGDLPIYPTFDSADVWANPECFKLDAEGRPRAVAGVPPDYFSETGQLWGNPVYDWNALKETGFEWWRRRLERNLRLFDLLRLDHFRGFVAFWEVPAGEETAVNGEWVDVPSEELFQAILAGGDARSLIAEDLGTITPDVTAFRRRLDIPGMKILLFAFDDDSPANPYLPHNHERECVVYTGTHDNNTVRGWFEKEAGEDSLERLFRCLGGESDAARIHLDLVRLAMSSRADTVIIPMQDLLGLGAEARMNRPSVAEGNWEWRLDPRSLTPELAAMMRELAISSGRAGGDRTGHLGFRMAHKTG